jgi:hypothetical protein
MRKIAVLLSVAVLSGAAGCTWVPLTEEGRGVEVIANNEVTDCKRVGNTKGMVLRKLWFVPRRQAVVEEELETLARNEGGKLGGNTVTPMGSERNGKREFAVYVCGD